MKCKCCSSEHPEVKLMRYSLPCEGGEVHICEVCLKLVNKLKSMDKSLDAVFPTERGN